MQYMLLIYGDESGWASIGEEQLDTLYAEYGQLTQDLRDQGKLISSNELQPPPAATSVRVRDDEALVTDGPFADTKEVLGGYYLIEAESLEEALAWAARIPNARDGVVEVRPVVMREAEVEA